MGGASGDGIVYEVSSSTHALSTVATFSGMNGASPFVPLVVGSSGNLYGTTVGGGANNDGTVYKIASGTHSLSTLAVFNNTNGTAPWLDWPPMPAATCTARQIRAGHTAMASCLRWPLARTP